MEKTVAFVTVQADDMGTWFLAYLEDDYNIMNYLISRGNPIPAPTGSGPTRMAAIANLAHTLSDLGIGG